MYTAPAMPASPVRHRRSPTIILLMSMIGATLNLAMAQNTTLASPPAAIEAAYLKSSNSEAADLFGYAIDIDGDLMVIRFRSVATSQPSIWAAP